MSKYRKFVNDKDTIKEEVLGRDHYWHYNDIVSQEAETYMVRVVMKKGGNHDFHRHPEMNEILYFLKGKAEQWVEDEMNVMEPGDSVYIAPNLVHATFNVGDEDLEFLAILAPSIGWEAGTIDEYMNMPYAKLRTKYFPTDSSSDT